MTRILRSPAHSLLRRKKGDGEEEEASMMEFKRNGRRDFWGVFHLVFIVSDVCYMIVSIEISKTVHCIKKRSKKWVKIWWAFAAVFCSFSLFSLFFFLSLSLSQAPLPPSSVSLSVRVSLPLLLSFLIVN